MGESPDYIDIGKSAKTIRSVCSVTEHTDLPELCLGCSVSRKTEHAEQCTVGHAPAYPSVCRPVLPPRSPGLNTLAQISRTSAGCQSLA